jgi:hypothetical protein
VGDSIVAKPPRTRKITARVKVNRLNTRTCLYAVIWFSNMSCFTDNLQKHVGEIELSALYQFRLFDVVEALPRLLRMQ